MQDMRDRPCANCGSKDPTVFAIVYRELIRARICVCCRRALDWLPTSPVNRVSESAPTVVVVTSVSGDDIQIEPLFTIGWSLFGIALPKIAQVFWTVKED